MWLKHINNFFFKSEMNSSRIFLNPIKPKPVFYFFPCPFKNPNPNLSLLLPPGLPMWPPTFAPAPSSSPATALPSLTSWAGPTVNVALFRVLKMILCVRENKKTTSERRGTTAHSNLKLSKFKDNFHETVFE